MKIGSTEPAVDLCRGLVTISGEPFVSVHITNSHFERWGTTRIRRYHRELRRYKALRWIPKPIRGWLRLPTAPPSPREIVITHCFFKDGSRVGTLEERR